MQSGALEHSRGERLIAAGRLVLSLFALAVAALDPDVSVIGAGRLIPIAAAFSLYAIIAMAIAWRVPLMSSEARLALHVIDFLLFCVFIQLTHASVSPFFIFFLFSLVSALLRFGVRGMAVTAVAALVIYIVMALTDPQIRSDFGYLMMRTVSVTVATLLLTYVGAYEQRIRAELTKLAAWPRSAIDEREPLVHNTLSLACDLLVCPRALLVWDEEEEPWVWVATLTRGELTVERERPDFLEEIVEDEWRNATFLSRPGFGTLVVKENSMTRSHSEIVAPMARERFQIGSVVSAPINGQTVNGRIFFLDGRDVHPDDAAIAEIVARLVATRLDQLNIAARVRDAAVTDERLRVARELHDGLLQSLTGASLQLELVYRLMDGNVDSARERLRNVQELIATEQRELRSLIMQLRPERAMPKRRTLQHRLTELAGRFQRQWDIGVSMNVDSAASELGDGLASELYGIVTEGLANAAKHARASTVAVTLQTRVNDVAVTIADDGVGFPFSGTYTLEELNTARRGPVTLKERVASLHGDLVLESTPSGSRIDIRIRRSAATLSV